ncbi:DNA-damage-inducible protein DinF [Mycobacterium tuberculosis]|nr:DNA-damage-inducible protein DinF [Mycobacterium tuberculosis]
MPRIAIRSHGKAAAVMPSPEAIADTSGVAVASTTTTTNAPRPNANQVACTPSVTAATRLPAP